MKCLEISIYLPIHFLFMLPGNLKESPNCFECFYFPLLFFLQTSMFDKQITKQIRSQEQIFFLFSLPKKTFLRLFFFLLFEETRHQAKFESLFFYFSFFKQKKYKFNYRFEFFLSLKKECKKKNTILIELRGYVRIKLN